ncbi:hypothetical protein, partial [Escherichia coli]
SQHLNSLLSDRDYTWNDNGELIRISSPRQTRSYSYSTTGRLTEKTDLIPEGGIRTDDERTHRYHYDSQHRLVHYTRTQYA